MDPLGGNSLPPATRPVQPSSLEHAFTVLAMVCIGLLCLIVTITVLSRWLYRPVIPDDVLVVRELMVAVILLPLAGVTAHRAHISVTVFTNWVAGRGTAFLSALGHCVGLMFVSWLIWAGWRLFHSAWTSGEYYDGDIYIPMWIGYAVFLVALMTFAGRLIAMIRRDIVAIASA